MTKENKLMPRTHGKGIHVLTNEKCNSWLVVNYYLENTSINYLFKSIEFNKSTLNSHSRKLIPTFFYLISATSVNYHIFIFASLVEFLNIDLCRENLLNDENSNIFLND